MIQKIHKHAKVAAPPMGSGGLTFACHHKVVPSQPILLVADALLHVHGASTQLEAWGCLLGPVPDPDPAWHGHHRVAGKALVHQSP